MGTTHELHDTSPHTGLKLVYQDGQRLGKAREGSRTLRELPPELVHEIRTYAEDLKFRFRDELADRAFAAKVGRLFTRIVLPKRRPPGRPQSPEINAAMKLLDEGVPWSQVPWKVLTGFDQMSQPEKRVASEQLRRAIGMRRKRVEVTNRKQVS